MKTINLSDRINENLIEFDAHLDALLEQGSVHNLESGDDDKKKGSGLAKGAAAAGIGAGGAGAGLYARGRSVTGGNAKGVDAMRVGARDISNKVAGAAGAVKSAANDARFYGNYYAGAGASKAKSAANATKAGVTKGAGVVKSAVKKAASKIKLDTLEEITSLCSEVDDILNFETIDDATAKKPVQKKKAPFIAGAALGLGTGAAAGYAGTKHSAQIVKAGKKGMTMAKQGYKTGKSKMAAAGKGVMSEISTTVAKLRKK